MISTKSNGNMDWMKGPGTGQVKIGVNKVSLSRCCLTCGYTHFKIQQARCGVCNYWSKKLRVHTLVSKPMVCENWLDAKEAEKKWDWERPWKRNSYWKRRIKNLNKIIWEKDHAKTNVSQ